MTTELTDDPELTTEDEAPVEPSKRFSLGNKKIKILVLLVLVMGLEGAALYFFLPQANSGSSQNSDEDQMEAQIDDNTIEVEIGKFIVTNNLAMKTVSMHLKFTVTAVVNQQSENDFHQNVSNDHRALVRQTVENVWRNANIGELTEPNLHAIKFKLREKINQILKQDYIRQVLVSDFTRTNI